MELCRDMRDSNSFQSHFRPSPLPDPDPVPGRLVLEAVDPERSDRPDRLARLFLIMCSLVDSASRARSSAVILRLLLGGFSSRNGFLVRASSSCCFTIWRFEMVRATSVMQAENVRRAVTAAMIIHVLNEFVMSSEFCAADVVVEFWVAASRGMSTDGNVAPHEGTEWYLPRIILT